METRESACSWESEEEEEKKKKQNKETNMCVYKRVGLVAKIGRAHV